MCSLQNSAQLELVACFSVWFLSVFYSIYCFATSSNNHFRNYYDEYSDFSRGWTFISRKKDSADFEWETMKFIIGKVYVWVILLVVVSEILRKLELMKILQLWRIFVTASFITVEMGILPLLIVLFQPLIFTVTFRLRNKFAIWICYGVALLFITLFKHYSATEEFLKLFRLSEKQVYITILSTFWMNLKCVSYYLDFLESPEKHRLIDFLSYILYLPTFLSGPFISHKDFAGRQQPPHFTSRLGRLVCDILRFVFWCYFTEFCLHFVYVNAAAFDPEWVASLDSWALYGYGYTMGQFFHLKYVVAYGLSTSVAKFENAAVPSLPVCIGRIHLYSDMWKYFDAGLYNFLLRYIYIPSIKLTRSRAISSLLCFIFVYVWHGTEGFILIWTVVNYFEVVIEYIVAWINRNYFEKTKLFHWLGPQNIRRISCLAASPLLAASAISNFYFFARSEIGHIFMFRILNDTLYSNAILMGILYCCCQISTELRKNRKTASKHQAEKLKL